MQPMLIGGDFMSASAPLMLPRLTRQISCPIIEEVSIFDQCCTIEDRLRRTYRGVQRSFHSRRRMPLRIRPQKMRQHVLPNQLSARQSLRVVKIPVNTAVNPADARLGRCLRETGECPWYCCGIFTAGGEADLVATKKPRQNRRRGRAESRMPRRI